MAKRIFSKRTLAMLMTLVMFFGMFQTTALAAPNDSGRWSYNFYLCHEYLGNAAGAAVKPDPLGYGFQGVFTDITFTDDDGVFWTFTWNTSANGDWKASGSNVSSATAKRFPATTDGKVYYGTCGGRAYAFTISTGDVPSSWTWVSDSSRATNWCGYIRFIREYTVNVFYQNETGTVTYNGEKFAAEAPLVRSFSFLYPDGGQIEDSENEDSDYVSPTTLLPADYLPQSMIDLGYEIKYATDASGKDVLTSGVTISLLGENVLNVYCTLIPPKTENYTVSHSYYTEGSFDGSRDGGIIEVAQNADFAEVVDGIAREPGYNGNTYTYISYSVDPANKTIVLTYTRQLPRYDYSVTYNANFGAFETASDSENLASTTKTGHNITADANPFSRDNYTFVGWNTKADGNGTPYAPGAVVALTPENNAVTLYAQWVENAKYDYSVVYNANFGENETVSDSQNVSGTYAASYTIGVDANGFARANYTFIGWATEADGAVVYQAGDSISFVNGGSQVLYAKWIEHEKYSYTVLYNGNGGLTGGEPVYADSENIASTYATSAAIGVDANSFVRPNYTFTGWNTASDGSGTAYAAADVISLTARNNSVTLYAQWEENAKYDYSVIYNANFGENQTKADAENVSGVYAASYSIGVDINTFTRPNYTFAGWNTESDGSGTAYAPGTVAALTAQNNELVLFAQWQENPKYDYTLIYNANFGTFETTVDGESVSDTYALSSSFAVDGNPFFRANYTFTGWNTASDGSGTAYAAADVITLTAENNTAVLYAQWTEHPKYDYSVIYNANFGEDETKADAENISGVYAVSHNVSVDANSFVRPNYTFTGWNTASDGSGTAYAASDLVALTAENNTAVLYAQWVENAKYDYSVVYNANFGANETVSDSENVSATYAASYTIGVDANSFERANHTFIGWAAEAEGEVVYQAGDSISFTEGGHKELFAKWEEHPKYDYSVTYHANFGANETASDSENVSATYAASYTIGVDANSFDRANHTFIGWAAEAEGEVVYQAGDSISFTEGGHVDLYAKWIEHDKYSYTVLYNGNGGALEDAALAYGDSENIPETYKTSAQIEVDANSFIRENYTFIGWNTASDGSGDAYEAEELVELTARNNSITLYAQWEENAKYDYSVIYNANFGENETASDSQNVTGTYAASYTIDVDANTFAREGYSFLGWATKADGQVVYQAGDSITFIEGGSQTLYAVWTINEYEFTVEYMVRVDGGEYEKFEGQLPENAPEGGIAPYGTTVDAEHLEFVPSQIEDEEYTYAFTALDEIVVPEGETVVIYYTYITPEPPVEEEPPVVEPPVEEPPATEPPATEPPATEPPATEPPVVEPPVEEPPAAEPPAAEPPVVEEPPVEEAPAQNNDHLIDLFDEDVPLADVPKTGDNMFMYVCMTVLSGMGLLGLNFGKKREEEEN